MSWEIVTKAEVAGIAGVHEETLKDEWYDWVAGMLARRGMYETYGTTGTITAEVSDGNGSPILKVRYPPIVSVTSLSISDTTVSSDNYVVYDNYIKLKRTFFDVDGSAVFEDEIYGGVFPMGVGNVSVTYVTGQATVPAHVKLAVASAIEQVALHSLRGGATQNMRYDEPDRTEGRDGLVPGPSLAYTVKRILENAGVKRVNFQ